VPDLPGATQCAVPRLHLASASPRRREILDSLGLVYTAAGVDVDERREQDETPACMVVRLAAAKARAARPGDDVAVLAADTEVVLDDRVFGKPAAEADTLKNLQRLLAVYSGGAGVPPAVQAKD